MLRFCLLCSFFIVLTAGRGRAQTPLFDANMPSVPWFDHVRQPIALTTAQGVKLASEARQGLLAGKTPEELAGLATIDASARVIFLSLGDGYWPERTYFAAGYDFVSAWLAVLKILQAREEVYASLLKTRLQKDIAAAVKDGSAVPAAWREKMQNPGKWDSLRLHIVQNALPINDFSIHNSRILLASLNGLAFRPADGLAFTPEQIMGRYLLSPERRLNESQVGNLIAETDNWGALRMWLEMANAKQKGRICLFEADCYFANATQAVRLFRGQPIMTGSGKDNSVQFARQAGERLLENLRPNGKLEVFFPEWVSGRADNGEFLSCQAELALAFARLATACQEKKFAEAASKVSKRLQKNCQKGSLTGRPFTFVLEDEEMSPDDKLQDSRKVVSLHTNALVCLALLETDAANQTTESRPLAKELVRYLCRQMERSGAFTYLLLYPEMRQPLDEFFSLESRVEAAALAALAIRKFADIDPDNRAVLLQRYNTAVSHLLNNILQDSAQENLPVSPWLAELLAQRTAATPEYAMHCARLAIAAGLQVNTQPLFPDFFGVPRDIPSLTMAAEHTWVTAVLANWLSQEGKKNNARDLLADTWPIWIFQQQARMDQPSASGLPSPHKYYHLFRDHLEDFGFDLNGQTTQIFSLLAVSSALQALSSQEYPRHEAQQEAWEKAWKMIDTHPFCLDASLVIDSTQEGPYRNVVGDLQQGKTVTIRTSGGKMTAVSPTVTTKVIERKTRTSRNKR